MITSKAPQTRSPWRVAIARIWPTLYQGAICWVSLGRLVAGPRSRFSEVTERV
jgi:hypothetical protein